MATYAGHEQCVKVLLEYGAALEAKSPETPLFVAAREGKIRCLQYLIEHGANVNVTDSSGQTPLHSAAFENQALVAKELVCVFLQSTVILYIMIFDVFGIHTIVGYMYQASLLAF